MCFDTRILDKNTVLTLIDFNLSLHRTKGETKIYCASSLLLRRKVEVGNTEKRSRTIRQKGPSGQQPYVGSDKTGIDDSNNKQ